jgi:hypothetical protein
VTGHGDIAFTYINNDDKLDAIFMSSDSGTLPNPQNNYRYRIAYNINTDGDFEKGWDNVMGYENIGGQASDGGGVGGYSGGTVVDVNLNGVPDIILMTVDNPFGTNNIRYEIGYDLGISDPNVASSWTGSNYRVINIDSEGFTSYYKLVPRDLVRYWEWKAVQFGDSRFGPIDISQVKSAYDKITVVQTDPNTQYVYTLSTNFGVTNPSIGSPFLIDISKTNPQITINYNAYAELSVSPGPHATVDMYGEIIADNVVLKNIKTGLEYGIGSGGSVGFSITQIPFSNNYDLVSSHTIPTNIPPGLYSIIVNYHSTLINIQTWQQDTAYGVIRIPNSINLLNGFRSNIKVVQLTDIHIGEMYATAHFMAILDMISKVERPDLVVITGDLINDYSGPLPMPGDHVGEIRAFKGAITTIMVVFLSF